MANRLPEVDQWYWHHDKGQNFYVTDIDEDNGTIEVQHFDGDVEEYTFREWRELDIEPSAPPENWSGPLDIGNPDDLGTGITDTSQGDWDAPARQFHDRAGEAAGKEDDYGEGHMEEEPLNGRDDDVPARRGETENLNRRPDGIVEESFDDNWYAEYSEDAGSGLWRADLYKHDTPEWRNSDFESLDEARQAALDYYNRQ